MKIGLIVTKKLHDMLEVQAWKLWTIEITEAEGRWIKFGYGKENLNLHQDVYIPQTIFSGEFLTRYCLAKT